MRKVIANILTIIVIVGCFISNNVSASSGSGHVTVPLNCVYVTGVTGVSRTTNYSYVEVGAYTIYPAETGVSDNYSKCRVRVYKNSNANALISGTTIVEENQGYYRVYLNQGYLSETPVRLCFAGNNASHAAEVDFYYDGK